MSILYFNRTSRAVMPPKVSSKGAKKAEKAKAVRAGDKKRKRRRKESYAISVYTVLKQVHTDTSISVKAVSIMNSFVNDIFERIAAEASRLSHCNKRSTITSREVHDRRSPVAAGRTCQARCVRRHERCHQVLQQQVIATAVNNHLE